VKPARRWWLVAAVALVAVLIGGRWLATETAERAWAATVAGGPIYITARNLARLMRLVVLVLSVGWGTLHLWFIYRSIGSVQMPRRIGNLEIVEAVPQRILLAGTLLAGLAFGIGLAWGSGDWWLQWLGASTAPHFGIADPILHRDVGYYLAELPWAETRQSYALLATLTALVIVGLLYVGIGSLRFRGVTPLASTHARGHLALLLACLALVLCWGALLDPAELVAGLHGPVVHAVVAARIPGARVVAGLAIVTALLSAAWAWWDRPAALSTAWGVLLASMIAVYALVPGLARGGRATPARPGGADTSYATERRAFSRIAFGADAVTVQGPDSTPQPPRGPLAIPAWDPGHVAAVVARSGRLPRGTTVAGVALQPELVDGAPAWLVAAAPDDSALTSASPAPDWAAVHQGPRARAGPPLLAVESDSGLSLRDAQYGSTATWFGPGFGQYAVLPPVASVPRGPGSRSGPAAPGGVPLTGSWRRLALAWTLQSPELLQAPARDQVLLWRRSAAERLGRLVPFASFGEAEPLLADGALWWVAYGYVESTTFPLADPLPVSRRLVRYRRAAVLGAVNAATGDTRLWLAPGHDSLAVAWARAFDGLVAPSESLPPALRRRCTVAPDGLRLAAAAYARSEQDTTEWKLATAAPYALVAPSSEVGGGDAVWLGSAFTVGPPTRLAAVLGGVLTEAGPRLVAWRQSLPDRFPATLVGFETRPGVARVWLAAGRLLVLQARFAEPEGGGDHIPPRIEKVFLTWGDRAGEGPSVVAAARDMLAFSPPDTALAARWDEVRSIAADMDAALAARDMEKFGRLYRRLLDRLGVQRKLAPSP
jgi:uncharacterized protein UPF0182